MNPNLAEEHLQTIRTLMERSALYRRALAPIMLLAGILGLLAAATGVSLDIDTPVSFFVLWLTTAVIAISGSFLIARRQALKDGENFWSAPTRRVAQALSLPFTAGLAVGLLTIFISSKMKMDCKGLLPFLWALFYGCALHSAGLVMPRGVKWFGWIYIGLASGVFGFYAQKPYSEVNGNCLMGFFFGGLHLAYGIYLYFTEKKTSAA